MSIITPFDPWKSKLCSCPQKYSLSAYTGCGHGCLYCYASSYIRNFSLPRPKKNFLRALGNDLKRIPEGSIITISNSSDPYQPLEKQLKLTKSALNILKNYPLRINIVTKSALIIRDLEILKELKNLFISFTFTTLNKALARNLEPYASLPQERLKAIEKLCRNFALACRLDPLIHPLNTCEIKEIIKTLKLCGVKQVITSTYKIKPDNFKRMCNKFIQYQALWQKFYFKEGEKIGGYIYLAKNLRRKLIEEVKAITLDMGLEFSSCREGFVELNTKNCDGTSLFEKH
jgi:DNA repair photolyase